MSDAVKLVYELTKKKYSNNYYNIMGNKKYFVKDLFKIIRMNVPKLKINFSKTDKRKYNYKINPFTYKLRHGSQVRLNEYISLESGIKNIINET